eukprot:GHVP01058065.1.p1 GENE.GHVP01058065.1~~GHVP01058065.1.p1  ORF type:complete len:149 (+),score=25.70 GHVP01058065.1:657-1103(+)
MFGGPASETEEIQYLKLPERIDGPGVSPSENVSRWAIIYPAYMDAQKSWTQGRRMKREDCVENPTIQEIADACALKARFVVENKRYPRDFLQIGRLRIQVERPLRPHKLDVMASIAKTVKQRRLEAIEAKNQTLETEVKHKKKGKKKK